MKEETPRIAADSGLYRMKWEYEREKNSSPDLLCFGTADMDYRSPEPVLDALQNVLDRGHLGYPMVPDRFYAAIHDWLERTTGWSVDARCCVSQCAGVYIGASVILSILTKPQDMVTILTPVHFCYKEILKLNDRKIIECPLELTETGYSIDFAKACQACFARWKSSPVAV